MQPDCVSCESQDNSLQILGDLKFYLNRNKDLLKETLTWGLILPSVIVLSWWRKKKCASKCNSQCVDESLIFPHDKTNVSLLFTIKILTKNSKVKSLSVCLMWYLITCFWNRFFFSLKNHVFKWQRQDDSIWCSTRVQEELSRQHLAQVIHNTFNNLKQMCRLGQRLLVPIPMAWLLQ